MGNGQGKPVDLTGEVNLNHFRLLRVVGRGAFGKVRIVERKDTNLSFALKYIRKDEVVKSESVRNIIRERRMLEHVNHPFICNLRYSFQDIEYMYLVVDLMSGGDLRFHISRKTFTEEAVRFWIAELGCALRYIHGQGIIHRDVKPDNVLLDADGHVHLTDFNVASDIIPGRILTSKSGTLAYLAPEVYSGKGYDVRADWWSLGVLFYECIYNKRPFDGNSESTLSQQILTTFPKYPVTQPPVSLTCLYAIRAALDPNPQTRLGSTWESFIYNDFFKEFDFDLLEQKRFEPIFVPSSDKTNFDATYDLEELLLEEAPLEARARRQKPRERLKEDATDQEIREDELYRMIEKDFRPFDYTVAAYKKITEATQGLTPSPGQTDTVNNGPQALTTDTATPIPARSDGNQTFQSPPLDRGSNIDSSNKSRPSRPAPPPPQYQSQYLSRQLPPTSNRITSPTGGVQVTLDGGGSWSELARQDATLPTDAATAADPKNEGSGGMFGFLKSKKGRNNSPKPKERGVLGKEGARVVIS
ncbi:Non-specific serine/threonine protein kinase [Purpureocillium takamizusanense]|uniref:Non-specific serine/threonine protein kinase n=1 Tax=Purpureocillium takamizusanense TaxID=2060973 RepID=A0A9Q8QM40_9HYPO|nr:Non-specific serine/threonine protein kinase [Purpureocillium takamizusanense]UNI22573.1 Non-specific serine/threonine protein kinase [Purpureocillium takamizusanense]